MTKTVFISGATSGIGLVAAQELDALGWKVYGAALPTDNFETLKNSCSEKFVPLPLDITNAEAVQAATKQIESETGSLNGLVNNAGINVPGALETLPLDAIRQQFEVNVFGHLQVTQAMLPLLRKADEARIVNTSSLLGKVAMPLLGAYAMSKHALEAMSDTLRLELAQFGIQVSIIEPGAVDTPMTDNAEEETERVRQQMSPDLEKLYTDIYRKMGKATGDMAEQAVPPQNVTKAIIHALTSTKPKTRYVISFEIQALMIMRKLAPDTVGDAILKRALGL